MAGVTRGRSGLVGNGGTLIVRDEKANTTNGGTFTSGAFRTRVLNTVSTNTITGASLATNQITLPSGTYLIQAVAPAYATSQHLAILYNITDSANTIIGTVEYAYTTGVVATSSNVTGVFTITAQKVFELRHAAFATSATYGFGVAGSFGVVEVYAQVAIFKLS